MQKKCWPERHWHEEVDDPGPGGVRYLLFAIRYLLFSICHLHQIQCQGGKP